MVHLFALSEHHDQTAKRILVRRIGLQELSNRRFGFLKPSDRGQGFDGQLDRFFIFRIGFDRLEQIVDSIIDILPRNRSHDDDFGKFLFDFRIAFSRIDHGLELDASQIERFAPLVDFLPKQVDPGLEHVSVDKLRVRLDGSLQVLHGLVGDLGHACGWQTRCGKLLEGALGSLEIRRAEHLFRIGRVEFIKPQFQRFFAKLDDFSKRLFGGLGHPQPASLLERLGSLVVVDRR